MSRMSKPEDKCVVPAKGPITTPAAAATPQSAARSDNGGVQLAMMPMVGREAPDFEASAYVDGGFANVKLSSYRGQWTVVCFYPGDFTFV
jgi:hypothetical protein